MNKITVSAKTVEDALTEASIELGLASTDIDYEVIEKGSAGFLGIGAKQAVITAWKKVEEKPKKEKKHEKNLPASAAPAGSPGGAVHGSGNPCLCCRSHRGSWHQDDRVLRLRSRRSVHDLLRSR